MSLLLVRQNSDRQTVDVAVSTFFEFSIQFLHDVILIY
jgi:hypothetical protein